MKTILKTLMLLPLLLILCSCAGGKWWVKYNPEMIANTPSVTIISMSPDDYRPGPGMTKTETEPAKLPPHFFEDLSTIRDEFYHTKMDLSFVDGFKDSWKKGIKEGIERNGNALIFFNTRPREYFHVAIHVNSPKGKRELFSILRKMSKRVYDAVTAYDPDGTKKVLNVYVNGVSSYRTYGIVALYDDKGIDYVWAGLKKIGHKSFTY